MKICISRMSFKGTLQMPILCQLQVLEPQLVPSLISLFSHDSAIVRKAVVDCLVELYLACGEPLMELLASLSPTQLKLVQIFASNAARRQSTSNP